MLTPDGQMYDDSGECQCSYCRGIRIRISHRAREARKMKLNEEIRQALFSCFGLCEHYGEPHVYEY